MPPTPSPSFRHASFVVVCALVAVVAVQVTPTHADPAPELERILLDLANQERARVGAPALTLTSDLTVAASAWSVEMVERRVFFHNPDLSDDVCCWSKVAENLAYRVTAADADPAGAMRSVHAQWMASQGHHANLVDPAVREVGIGVEAVGDPAGDVWYLVTAVFRTRRSGTTPPEVTRSARGAACGMPSRPFELARSPSEERDGGLARCATPDGGPTPPSARRIEPVCGGAPPAGFSDVPATNVHGAAIDCVTSYGIVDGKQGGRFVPAQLLRRDQLAALLARTLRAAGVQLPAPGDVPDYFRDDDEVVHEDDINVLAHLGVLDTSRDVVYPAALVSRAEMADLTDAALRTGGVSGSQTYDYFSDDTGWGQEAAINRLAFVGGIAGSGAGSYQPDARLRRDAAATFFARVITVLRA